MVERKVIEKDQKTEEIPKGNIQGLVLFPKSTIQGLVLFPKVDLSCMEIWNHKLERWIPVKMEGLTLFPENIGKCWKCGFYREHCCCQVVKKKKRFSHFMSNDRLNLLFIRYHKYMHLHLHKKADKFFYRNRKKSDDYNQRAMDHERLYHFHRQFQELQIKWAEVKIRDFVIIDHSKKNQKEVL